MAVSEHQAALLRTSFHQLRERLEPLSLSFYEALFRRRPDLRAMFRDDLAGQGMKFMTTLGIVVENASNPEKLSGRYSDLGVGHARMGVKAEHFEPMGEALIDALREELGKDFTDDHEAAWRAAYADLAQRMIGRGGIE